VPELPEVETTLRGIRPHLAGRSISAVTVRQDRLRYPLAPDLPDQLVGRPLAALARRGKYLLFGLGDGTLIVHLGMSGSLRILPAGTPPGLHDHVDIAFGDQLLRYRDPRRFGLMLWVTGDPNAHPLLARLGIEPLDPAFDGPWLYQASRGRPTPIKLFLMDSQRIVGVGNIYASESLFRARIHPAISAGSLGPRRCARLAAALRETLQDAIAAGGSSLRDFVGSDGRPGYFQQQYFVYGREGEPCRLCATPIRKTIMGQRATFHCPRCQGRRRPENP
jgi:formamidopyrimidine-DNA glycosylase